MVIVEKAEGVIEDNFSDQFTEILESPAIAEIQRHNEEFQTLVHPKFETLKVMLDKSDPSWEYLEFIINYAYANNKSSEMIMEKKNLHRKIDGDHLHKYEFIVIEDKKLVFQKVAGIEICRQNLLAATYDCLVLMGKIENSDKEVGDICFLGELNSEISKIYQETKGKKLHGCSIYGSNLIADIAFTSDNESPEKEVTRKGTVNVKAMEVLAKGMDFYYHEDDELPDNEKGIYNIPIMLDVRGFLQNLEIELCHAWIPEVRIVFPNGIKRSLDMFFAYENSAKGTSSLKDFSQGRQLTSKGINNLKKGFQEGCAIEDKGNRYAIIYFSYGFHVINWLEKENVVMLLDGEKKDWVNLETKLDTDVVLTVRLNEYERQFYTHIFEHKMRTRAIKAYIERHKEISLGRKKVNIKDVDLDACEECGEGKKLISHNVNGLYHLLCERPDC
ncbi:hypothetical protein OROHE_014508 [Orobanche hederae]